ncbi:hypothetical protein CEQ90_10340 [Lewinellaceae bacterium SD302]|nr:hypothetical protein CEQ90_10340 [Lewinellaceae bacterium SD302]
MTKHQFEKLLYRTTHRHHSDECQAYVEQEPDKLLPVLLDHFCGTNPQTIGVASMVLGNLARVYPQWLQPHQERIFRASVAHFHPGPRRNAIRYFSELPVVLEADHPIPDWVTRKDFLYYLPLANNNPGRVAKHSQPPEAYVEPELEGLLLDHVLARIADPQETAAPKAFGMLVGQNLCLKYPEIAPELSAVIEEAIEYGTAGIKNRGKKTLILLEKLG